MLRMVKPLGCRGATTLPRMPTPILLAVGPSRTPPQLCKAKEYNGIEQNKLQNDKFLPIFKMEITIKLTSKKWRRLTQ